MKKRARIVVPLLLVLIFFGIFGLFKASIDVIQGNETVGTVSFVIIGATGDLAKKKIWPSVREIIFRSSLVDIRFYAAAKDLPEVTFKTLSDYWDKQECPKEWKLTFKTCSNLNAKLKNSITSIKLKDADDYLKLNEQMIANSGKEALRVFYLAVPPFAYSGIANNVNKYCRPSSGELRIAVEKPFGRDLMSAEDLADDLRKYLSDDEIYLVDHYLHKKGVEQIYTFLKQSSDTLKPIWNRKSVKYVEIVAREKVNVKGRTAYYDHYGVIRDMLQSHLTELMAIVSTASNMGDRNELKREVLQKVVGPLVQSSYIGQYREYQSHAQQDSSGSLNVSKTPTFASVLLYIQNEDWFGVPFFLISGKSLGKREGFVRVVFQDEAFSTFTSENCNPEIMFTFNPENSGEHPTITVFPSIPDLAAMPVDAGKQEEVKTGSCQSQIITLASTKSSYLNAYTSVILGLINGEKQLFVPLKNIIQSWKIWTPLLQELETEVASSLLHVYDSSIFDHLIFSAEGTKLTATVTDNNVVEFVDGSPDHNILVSSTGLGLSTLHVEGRPAYIASRSTVIKKLASDLYHAALKSVDSKGVFHLALPGGSSPLLLFQILSLDYGSSFPWRSTHVWQTDERCVATFSEDSNINQLQCDLLNFVGVPPDNIHPILPNVDSYVECSMAADTDSVNDLLHYDSELGHLFENGNGGLDYVLLGIGRDGHIGSIFPHQGIESYHYVGKRLVVVKLKSDYPIKVKERISLQLSSIVHSSQIGLLVTGNGKCQMMNYLYKRLREDELPPNDHEDAPVIQLLFNEQAKLALYFDSHSMTLCDH